ncbi:DNA-binding transcriptional regulator AraC [compost metagenome]
MEYWIDFLEWPAMALTVLAAWCIGSRRPGRRKLGFCCFLASNVLWAIWGWQAKALMTDSALNLLEIGLECGFADQSHFSRVFLKQVGTYVQS